MPRRFIALVLTLVLGLVSWTARSDEKPAGDSNKGSVLPRGLHVEALRAVAADIERQVAEGNHEPVLKDVEGLVVDTPAIRQAVRTRAARIGLVKRMLDSGFAWERRNGRLWILRSAQYKKATSTRQRDTDAMMVNGENRDRWAIYEGILKANHLPTGALSVVEQTFFEARKQHLTTGQRFEEIGGAMSQAK